MKRLIFFVAGMGLAAVAGAANPVRYVQISTNSVTQQSGSFNVSGGTMTTMSVTGTGSFSGQFTGTAASTFTVSASSATLGTATSTITVNGPISLNSSVGTTYDMWKSSGNGLGGSWSHKGLVIQSTQTVLSISSATTSGSFIPTTAFHAITPLFSNSLIRVTAFFTLNNANLNNAYCQFTLERNASNLFSSTTGMSETGGTSATTLGIPIAFSYDDLPNSTSALTYKIYIQSNPAGTTCTLGRVTTQATIIRLEEIGQ